ncbi:MAG: hypothetical protein CM1200mP21_09320 [Candidatus Poseidoniales archaeon]|nr:MAG: hypothetical protein CM1200mP21_09320 [Candidatus Poseidoniales archaeon]
MDTKKGNKQFLRLLCHKEQMFYLDKLGLRLLP